LRKMGYTGELRELIKKVEASRPARFENYKIGKSFPVISLDERQSILEKFHPDYKVDGKREVRVGPNAGEFMPNEFVDILESKSIISNPLHKGKLNLDKIDYETDLLIIGGGGAGASAAIMARKNGVHSILCTKLRFGDANTMMAEGGIQAACSSKDSPTIHYIDALGGGHFSNDPDLLEILTETAPSIIQWLTDLGMLFDRDENGEYIVNHGGGTSRKRMFSAGDMSGADIMRTLRDEVTNHPEDTHILEFSPAVELLLDEQGHCAGAVLFNLDTEVFIVVKSKCTIVTTGGGGRLHYQNFVTTNHYGATADGLVMVYHLGVPLRFMHSMQYHPTGCVYPEQNVGLLITEKFRGMGGQLLNRDGKEFVFPREPRDVASSAIIRECQERKKGITTESGRVGVWLDSPLIELIHEEGTVKRRFPAKYKQFMRHGIDISKVPMLIYPTLHYQNGGARINASCETTVPNLFMAGEVTGGVHGENRLMGNSLLDILVFGCRAGTFAAQRSKETAHANKIHLEHVISYEQELQNAGIYSDRYAPMLLPDYRFKVG